MNKKRLLVSPDDVHFVEPDDDKVGEAHREHLAASISAVISGIAVNAYKDGVVIGFPDFDLWSKKISFKSMQTDDEDFPRITIEWERQ